MPDGPAAPSVFIGIVDQFIYDRMGITGQGVRGDNHGQINIFGFRVFQFQYYIGVEVYF